MSYYSKPLIEIASSLDYKLHEIQRSCDQLRQTTLQPAQQKQLTDILSRIREAIELSNDVNLVMMLKVKYIKFGKT